MTIYNVVKESVCSPRVYSFSKSVVVIRLLSLVINISYLVIDVKCRLLSVVFVKLSVYQYVVYFQPMQQAGAHAG